MSSLEAGGELGLTVEQRYVQMCTDIRFTDDISLKLLGLIPLVSGAGILTVLFAGPDRSRSEAALLGAFVGLLGAIVTFAVYMWERRNLKFCEYLIGQVAALEAHSADMPFRGHHLGRPEAPRFGPWRMGKPEAKRHDPKRGGRMGKTEAKRHDSKRGWRMGKTQAERILYTTVIISWLALPGIAALLA
jgi:hypothetical protein